MKVIQMRILMRCKEGAFWSNMNIEKKSKKKKKSKKMKDHNHQNNI